MRVFSEDRFFGHVKGVVRFVDGNQKSGVAETPVEVGSLSVYSIIYKVLYIQKVVFSPDFWTINYLSDLFGDCFQCKQMNSGFFAQVPLNTLTKVK